MTTCATCGAPQAEPGEQLFCKQCGARVARGVADLEEYRTAGERFERVAVAPGYQRAMEHEPPFRTGREVGGPLWRFVTGSLMTAVFVIIAIRSPDWKIIAFVAVAGTLVVGAGFRGLQVALARWRAPLRREVEVVTADVFAARGKKCSDPTGVAEHRVTLQGKDGASRTVFAAGVLMGDVGIGDIGIAYTRHDRMLDYRWFDVMAPPLAAGEPPRAAACATCGAHPRFGPVSERCDYCGDALAAPDLGEFGARFRAAAASPAAQAAARRRVTGGVPPLLPGLAMIGTSIFFVAITYQLREPIADAIAYSPWFVLLLAVPAASIIVTGFALWRLSAPHRAPRQNELAVVVRTRTAEVRSTREKKTMRHFATVASPSGARRELSALPELVGRLERGQLGVAHLRGEWLADFTPLDSDLRGAPT